jgi:hypothetical protein
MKRLFIDIETSLSVMAAFSLWDPINYKNILKEWYVICAAWKWDGQKRIYCASSDGDDDSALIKRLAGVIEEADEIVYHNGKKFDFKKIQTRALFHRLPPIPKPRECDTLIQCKKHFGFTSNRLDYIANYLGVGHKMSTSPGLWLKVLDGNQAALKEMMKYNKVDVQILEDVHKAVQPYIDTGYNLNQHLSDQSQPVCPACGSSDLEQRGWSYTAATKKKRVKCRACHKWSAYKTGEGSTEVR